MFCAGFLAFALMPLQQWVLKNPDEVAARSPSYAPVQLSDHSGSGGGGPGGAAGDSSSKRNGKTGQNGTRPSPRTVANYPPLG